MYNTHSPLGPTVRTVCFCLSSLCFVLLGMANLVFVPFAYLSAAAVSLLVLLFCVRKISVPALQLRWPKQCIHVAMALLIIFVRGQYFFGDQPFYWLLAAGSFYSVFYLLCMLSERWEVSHLEAEKTHSSAAIYAMLFVLSLAFLLLYAEKSPMDQHIHEGDYSIFYLIGKAWTQGLIPYADTFDHKGPLIFFVYALGYRIHPDYGIFVMQVLFLWVSLSIAYRIPQIGSRSHIWGMLSVFSVLLFLYKQEYSVFLCEAVELPFLMAATYAATSWFSRYERQLPHPPVYAFFYGLAAASAFLCRPSDTIGIAVYVVCILVILLASRQFGNILQNMVGCLGGFLVLTLPFLVYFAINGALYDMIWGSILFNILYAGGSEPFNFYHFKRLIYATWPVWGLILISILVWKRQNKAILISNILAALVTAYLVSSGYRFSHYYIVLSPFIPVALMLLARLESSQTYRTARELLLLVLILCMFVSWCGRGVVKEYELSIPYPNDYESAAIKIGEKIPEEDRDAVSGYNTNSLFYLCNDLQPCYKYFTNQDWQSMKSEQMQQENAQFYRSGKAKWVVVESSILREPVREAIESNYVLQESIPYGKNPEDVLMLYKWAD